MATGSSLSYQVICSTKFLVWVCYMHHISVVQTQINWGYTLPLKRQQTPRAKAKRQRHIHRKSIKTIQTKGECSHSKRRSLWQENKKITASLRGSKNSLPPFSPSHSDGPSVTVQNNTDGHTKVCHIHTPHLCIPVCYSSVTQSGQERVRGGAGASDKGLQDNIKWRWMNIPPRGVHRPTSMKCESNKGKLLIFA